MLIKINYNFGFEHISLFWLSDGEQWLFDCFKFWQSFAIFAVVISNLMDTEIERRKYIPDFSDPQFIERPIIRTKSHFRLLIQALLF